MRDSKTSKPEESRPRYIPCHPGIFQLGKNYNDRFLANLLVGGDAESLMIRSDRGETKVKD